MLLLKEKEVIKEGREEQINEWIDGWMVCLVIYVVKSLAECQVKDDDDVVAAVDGDDDDNVRGII